MLMEHSRTHQQQQQQQQNSKVQIWFSVDDIDNGLK